MGYSAPVAETSFYIRSCTSTLALRDNMVDLDGELSEAILTEAGNFAADVLLPLDRTLDTQGVRFEHGAVRTAPGHKDVYRQFREGGWLGLSLPASHGGQDLPQTLTAACQEFWHAGSMAFSMGTLLTVGAAETLYRHASDEQKRIYVPKLVSGEWMATMALTEPSAGSDLGDIRTRAEPTDNGRFLIKGSKIFISYGDHDLSDNIVHLVLARLPNAPPGSRGLSLFLVPKYIPQESGDQVANDLHCVGIEGKLGQHGSPTCTMAFGPGSGAVGWIVGEPHRGLAAMFTMMNSARLAVAMQGVAVGERATQAALDFASERRQGRARDGAGMAAIATHPDVWRMLMTMRSTTTAARFIALSTADAIDRSRRCATEAEREAARLEADILTPVAKTYCTDSGIETASLAIQIHGGMGYVEETGIAQLWRDARVTSIYEGTNGIHAIDFLTRKLGGGGALHFLSMIDRFEQTAAQLAVSEPKLAAVGELLGNGCRTLRARLTDMINMLESRKPDALSLAAPFLRLAALVTGGCLMARAVVVRAEDPELRSGLEAALRFFATFVLSDAASISNSIVNVRRLGRDGETPMPDVVQHEPEAGAHRIKPRHRLGETA